MTQHESDTQAGIAAAMDEARAAEREERDARTRDQLEQTERISDAMGAGRHRSTTTDR